MLQERVFTGSRNAVGELSKMYDNLIAVMVINSTTALTI